MNISQPSQLPHWLMVSLLTTFGGTAAFLISSSNAFAVLGTSAVSSALGTTIVSKQQKNKSKTLPKFVFQPKTQPTQAPPTVEVEEKNSVEKISAYLQTRSIIIESHRLPKDIDVSSDQIADFLGKKYTNTKDFYKTIKRNLSTGKRFTFRLATSSQQAVSNCTQLGSMLYKSSFLSSYRYLRKEKLIVASTQTRGDMINFLTGEWFERYIYNEIIRFLKKHQLKYESLSNLQIRFGNEDKFELDILFYVQEKLIWLECKTKSDISDCLQRYSRHRENLGIPAERAFIVALDIPETQASELSKRWQITVVNQENFLEKISEALDFS